MVIFLVEKQATTKYQSVRTQFVKNKGLLDQASRSGAGGAKPKLWRHYDAALFLKDHVEVAQQTSTLVRASTPTTQSQASQVWSSRGIQFGLLPTKMNDRNFLITSIGFISHCRNMFVLTITKYAIIVVLRQIM